MAIELAGRDKYGDRHEGLLRLTLHLKQQQVIGTYRTETAPNTWEESKFTVEGKFLDRGFSTFEGEWREPGFKCYFEIINLPPAPHQPPRSKDTTRKRRQ